MSLNQNSRLEINIKYMRYYLSPIYRTFAIRQGFSTPGGLNTHPTNLKSFPQLPITQFSIPLHPQLQNIPVSEFLLLWYL